MKKEKKNHHYIFAGYPLRIQRARVPLWFTFFYLYKLIPIQITGHYNHSIHPTRLIPAWLCVSSAATNTCALNSNVCVSRRRLTSLTSWIESHDAIHLVNSLTFIAIGDRETETDSINLCWPMQNRKFCYANKPTHGAWWKFFGCFVDRCRSWLGFCF